MYATFTPRRRASALTLAGMGLILSTGLAVQPAQADDLSTSPYLFGDWGGTRTKLAEEGVTFNLGYGSEAAHNFTGGTDHLTRYTDQWVLGTALDLDKLMGWHGATFHFLVTDRNGRDLGADAHIGNNQLIQEVFGRSQTWHLTDFSLEQKLLNDRLTLKFGRMTVGGDFASFSCDFQNLTFCGSQPGNIVGSYWVNWPTSVWAANAKFKTTQETYVSIGAYQVNPAYTSDSYARTKGLIPDFPDGTTGALIPVEFGYMPTVNGYPGSYKFGAWYNTSNTPDLVTDVNGGQIALTGAAPMDHNGAYGGYINFMQQVSGHPGGDGASVFLNISMADKDTSATDSQFALGMEYKGVMNRPRDMIGLALGGSHANGRNAEAVRLQNELNPQLAQGIVNDGEEYVAEAFYSWSPIPSMSFRPNLQYILHPGGSTQNSNALIIGLKTTIAF
jgi:porin